MKKMFVMLIGVMLLMPIMTWAQTRVQNRTANKVVISYGGQEYLANPSQTISCSALPANGTISFEAWYYQGFNKISLGKLTREIKGEKMVLDQLDQKTIGTVNGEQEKPAIKEVVNIKETSGDWWSTTTVVPVNESSHRFMIPAYPFRGLSLRPGQSSEKSTTLKTGEYVFPVYYDADEDSTSTGRNYKWTVMDKIITEGQEKVIFSDKDFTEIQSGKTIKKPLRNNLSVDIYVVGGIHQGRMISAKAYTKLKFMLGWNIIPVQYKNEDGLPVQAILLLMVNDIKRPLTADRKDGHRDLSIERDNIIIL